MKIRTIVLGLAVSAMIASCGAQDDLKNFEMLDRNDTLSYAIGVAATSDIIANGLPMLNGDQVMLGAQDFIDSNLSIELRQCYDIYGQLEKDIREGTLGLNTSKESVVKARTDSFSYAVGAMISANHKRIDLGSINPLAVKAGIRDFRDSTFRLSRDTCIELYQRAAFDAQQKRRVDQMRAMEEKAKEYLPNKKAGEEYLAANADKPGIKITESGLQYRVIKEGKGPKPAATDMVSVHYTGRNIAGEVFDSSVERGEPTQFQVGGVIRGWTEGLQLMSVGAKYEFFIPQELAYGIQSRGPKITPYSALIFEVELLEIIQTEQQNQIPNE